MSYIGIGHITFISIFPKSQFSLSYPAIVASLVLSLEGRKSTVSQDWVNVTYFSFDVHLLKTWQWPQP